VVGDGVVVGGASVMQPKNSNVIKAISTNFFIKIFFIHRN